METQKKLKPSISQIINYYHEDEKAKDSFKKNLSARQIRFKRRQAQATPFIRTQDKASENLFLYSMFLKQTQVTTQTLNPFRSKTMEGNRKKLLELTNRMVDELEADLAKETSEEGITLDESYWDASELFFDFALHSFKNYAFLKMIIDVLNLRPEFTSSIVEHIENLEKAKNAEHQESTCALPESEG